MKIQIFRGAEEIGGTCIHLASNNTSIALDMGTPLTSGQSRGFAQSEAPAGESNNIHTNIPKPKDRNVLYSPSRYTLPPVNGTNCPSTASTLLISITNSPG